MKVIHLKKPDDAKKKNFTTFVNETIGQKPFVIFVYADWCGHCRHAHPKLDEAIKNRKTTDDISIVKISDEAYVSLNKDDLLGQILSLIVSGYPTIAKVSNVASNNTVYVTEFKGNRETNEFEKFMSPKKTQKRAKPSTKRKVD